MKTKKMDYSVLIEAISKVHQQAQSGAAGAVNRYLIFRNWIIGGYLIEFEQNGKDRAEYGTGLLEKLSRDLRMRGVTGLGISMLKNCRQFYKIYPQFRQPVIGEFKLLGKDSAIRQALIGELDFQTHFIEFIRLEDVWKRAFYENECLKGNWSVRQLQRQIGSLFYERTGLSTDKA